MKVSHVLSQCQSEDQALSQALAHARDFFPSALWLVECGQVTIHMEGSNRSEKKLKLNIRIQKLPSGVFR